MINLNLLFQIHSYCIFPHTLSETQDKQLSFSLHLHTRVLGHCFSQAKSRIEFSWSIQLIAQNYEDQAWDQNAQCSFLKEKREATVKLIIQIFDCIIKVLYE